MGINWSKKNRAELELFFSTDIKKGLTHEQYLQAKEQYGENIIDSDLLEQQNFYGLKKKKRNIKAMMSGSVGIAGVLYFFTVILLKIMQFDINIYIFLSFYIFMTVSAFVLSSNSEKKYEYLYKIARPKALVIRGNKRKKVYIENIVPGDVILLSAGDIVPADARIVSESPGYLSCIHITKEGTPVRMRKTAGIIENNTHDSHTRKPMSANIVYAADVVESGNASAVVIATGKNTHIANTANTAQETENDDGKNTVLHDEYSIMQKYAHKLSRDFFLVSVFLSMLIIIAGIMQERDFLTLIMTCLTVLSASFSEQIPIIADFAVLNGMHRLSKFGILVKKTSIIDEINDIDTVIAKKNESFTQENKMKLEKISDKRVSNENASEIGYILSCMAMCSNVDISYAYTGQNKNKSVPVYSGSAIDVAVFEALSKCGLNYDGLNQSYQKIGKTIYNPKNGIKSAIVLTTKSRGATSKLMCFGEAFNILERCVKTNRGFLDARNLKFYKDKIEDLYKEHDFIMAVAAKDFSHRELSRQGAAKSQTHTQAEMESGLEFLGFASFSEPKTSAVFESIDYLKKSGVTPVMIADSDTVYSRSAAVKFGIVKNQAEANILNDDKINRMGDSMFFINADKFRLFTPIALENRIKFLQALKFRKKFPAITINDIEEKSLLNEPCVTFTSVSAETGILKNKASVITRNLTVSTILRTVKNSVLIYRNIGRIAHFSSMLFVSQYLLILFAVLLNGAYILNPTQIIWSGIGAGYIFTIALCFNEDNKNWHILRNSIKKYKEPKKFNKVVIKYGLIYGLLIFIFVALSFFVCLIMQKPAPFTEIIKQYINSDTLSLKSAQTAAFIAYIVSCILLSLSFMPNHIKSSRFRISPPKNKIFTAAFMINFTLMLCAVFIPAVRDFFDFGGISVQTFAVSVFFGLCPCITANLFRKKIFFM